MVSEDFKKLFADTFEKIAKGTLKDSVGDNVIIKHYFQTSNSPYSTKIPVVKNINNPKLFLEKMEELHNLRMDFYEEMHASSNWNYHQLEEFILGHTFFRATIQDFENPLSYLEKEISFLKNDTIKELYQKGNFNYISDFNYKDLKNTQICVSLEKNLVGFEANNCLKIKLVNKDFQYYFLPDVHFDLDKKEAYIKGIQKSDENEELKNEPWTKKIRKITFEANKDNPNKEKVPPTHLISLLITISFLQTLGYQKFSFPTHHPLRNLYYNGYHKMVAKKEANNDEELKRKLKEKDDYINNINYNITNRFLDIVSSYIDCFPQTQILDYGDDLGYFTIDTSRQKEYENNHLLHFIHNQIHNNFNIKK